VREQFSARNRVGHIAAGGKGDVVSVSERLRVQSPRRFRGAGIGMHTHVAEIASEARFEIRPRGRRQGLPARTHCVDGR